MIRLRAAAVLVVMMGLPVVRVQATPKTPPLEKLPSKSAGKATKPSSGATATRPRTAVAVSRRAETNSSLAGTTWIATVYWFDYSRFGKPPSSKIVEVDKYEFKFLRGGKFEGGVADHTTDINGTWIQKGKSVTVKDPKISAPWNGKDSKIVATIKGNIMTGRGTRNDNQQFRFKAIRRRR